MLYERVSLPAQVWVAVDADYKAISIHRVRVIKAVFLIVTRTGQRLAEQRTSCRIRKLSPNQQRSYNPQVFQVFPVLRLWIEDITLYVFAHDMVVFRSLTRRSTHQVFYALRDLVGIALSDN